MSAKSKWQKKKKVFDSSSEAAPGWSYALSRQFGAKPRFKGDGKEGEKTARSRERMSGPVDSSKELLERVRKEKGLK